MQFDHITTERQLQQFCQDLNRASVIALDTEFVSEDTYRPDLCLIQVAALGRLVVIDPRAIGNIAPFWKQLVTEDHVTIVHAGREEFRFCLRATGKVPSPWFDVQLAAGLAGIEYPASYANLVTKLLGKTLSKGETRTDWRKRPLTARQLEYALLDVVHLEPLHDELDRRLQQLDRLAWLRSEIDSWQHQLRQEDSAERWRRVSGIAGLSSRSLAIARELWRWREEQAEALNRPPRRVLRDDLLVELARRSTADMRRIGAIRGLERSTLKRKLPEIATVIQRALELPEDQWPRNRRSNVPPQVNVVAQFLSTALGNLCRQQQLAPSLLGTVQDIRDLVAHRLGYTLPSEERMPMMTTGWRAQLAGQLIDELLSGKVALRIRDPSSDEPLSLQRCKE